MFTKTQASTYLDSRNGCGQRDIYGPIVQVSLDWDVERDRVSSLPCICHRCEVTRPNYFQITLNKMLTRTFVI